MTAAWNPTAAPETERLGNRFVCRVSGAPADGFEALRGERTAELAAGLLALDARARAEREEVSALLFDAIGTAADRPTRNRLLALKRTLYNLRPAAAAALEAGCAPLAPEAGERVRGFAALLEARAAAEAELRDAHGQESARVREGFRALLRDPDFRKGLLVSSRSLHGSLERYAAAGATLSGRDEKTERGLLRYYTRMAMKATPFSVFCAILPGRFTPVEATDGEGPPVRVHGDPRRKRSFVRINKTLYGLLLDHLKTRPAVRRALVVEANPTLRTEGERLVFLTALQSREVFQRVGANDVLTLIGNVFRGRAATTLGELVDALVADPQVDATADEAAAYLDKLLEIGFLRFHTGIREQDADWDLPLRTLLEGIDDDHARRSAALLAQVRAQSEAYAVAGPEARAGLIQEMLDAVTAALESMEVTARLRKDMPFYEDATADAEATAPLTPGLARAVDTFTRWVRLTSRLAWPRPEGATMRHFFDSYYDAATGGVPLLQFYEDFYREHFKGHVEKEQQLRAGVSREELAGYDVGNPYGLEFIRVLVAARGRLAETVRDRWIEAGDVEEVSITLDEVERALSEVPPQAVPCRSVDAFVCLAPPAAPGGDERVVLGGGSYTAGYGKYFSRFLYMLPDEVTEAVREGNGALTDEYLAEICGDSQFNANLHPPLLRWEISYPTGESGAAEDQLRSSELLVARDPGDPHALLVRHAPTGRRVLPVDLGFLNPRMRPPLYQLLSRFTVPVTFAPSLPESPERRPAPTPAREAAAEDAVAAAAAPVEDVPADVEASAEDAEATSKEGKTSEDGASAEDGTPTDAPVAQVPPRVTHRPRITVDGRLVLARRRWLVPGALFPQREGDESAADFFVRVQRWRAEHGLPEVAYLRIAPLPDPAARKPGEPAADAALPDAQEAAMGEDVPAVDAEAEVAEEEAPAAEAPAGDAAAGAADGAAAAPPARPRTAGSRDLHKPQFMDFGNPLLVGLLGKMAANLRHFQVVVEERLPDRDGLAPGEGGSYVTELVVQLDFPAAATAAEAPAREETHAAVV